MSINKLAIYAGIALSSVFLSFNSHAGSITNCTGGSGDYGDAPSSYGVACHDTNNWQQLGDTGQNRIYTNDFNNIGWSSESSSRSEDTGDNGVKWRTSADGVNWTDYGQSEKLVQGKYVQFQVDVNRSKYGGHNNDEFKLWLDWFGTGSFNESDVVFHDYWIKNQDSDGNFDASLNAGWNGSLGTRNSAQEFGSFFSSILEVPTNSILGEVWMRARIICDFSLNQGNNFMLSSTGYYHQGEVEDYQMHIVRDVNAPATAILVSLFALGFAYRKMQS